MRKIKLFALLAFLAAPASAGFWGGELSDHGHTAPGDGGTLSNPTISGGNITPTTVQASTITATALSSGTASNFGTSTIRGNETITGGLSVTGASTFTAQLNLPAGISSTGNNTFSGTTTFTGQIVISSWSYVLANITSTISCGSGNIQLDTYTDVIDAMGEMGVSTFTAQRAGTYKLTVQQALTQASGITALNIFVRKNGAAIPSYPIAAFADGATTTMSTANVIGGFSYSLEVGDTLSLYATCTSVTGTPVLQSTGWPDVLMIERIR